ncbi:hypothetical protein Hanom_Chr09g00769441 [Helianthus anomalus]
MCNQTAFYWFSTYWFRPSYPFRHLIHSALIGSDVAKQPLTNVEKITILQKKGKYRVNCPDSPCGLPFFHL